MSSIQALLSRLDQAASSEGHIAARYSKLIDRLFNKRSSLNKTFNAPIGQEAPQDKTSKAVHSGEGLTSDSQMPQLNVDELTGINGRIHDPMLTSVGTVTNDGLDPLLDLGFSEELEMGLDNDFLNDYGTFNLDLLPFGSF